MGFLPAWSSRMPPRGLQVVGKQQKEHSHRSLPVRCTFLTGSTRSTGYKSYVLIAEAKLQWPLRHVTHNWNQIVILMRPIGLLTDFSDQGEESEQSYAQRWQQMGIRTA